MNDEVKELLLSYLLQLDSKGRKRKVIFWYDEKQDYINEINDLQINDVNIRIFDNNSFKLRYEIEIEKPTEDFILYFPFSSPKGLDNELLDLETANESYKFNPDQTTMWLKELELSDNEYQIVKNNYKFFKDKKRRQKFKEFDLKTYEPEVIELVIIASLLNLKTYNTDEIFKNLFISYYKDKKKFDEVFKWSNEKKIFDIINSYFGSNINQVDDFDSFYKSLIFTYFVTDLENMSNIDKYKVYILSNKTNVHVFVDMLMRDLFCQECFETVSKVVANEFGIADILENMDIKDYKFNDAFIDIDYNILSFICDSLISDVNQYTDYSDLIQIRSGKYWSKKLANEYNSLKYAIKFFENIESLIKKIKTMDIDDFISSYVTNFAMLDTLYRKFNYYIDKIEINEKYKTLRNLIENKYVNDFINKLSINWSNSIEDMGTYDSNRVELQNSFYKNHIKQYESKKNRVIVIISDALRYEVAEELNSRLLELGAKSNIGFMLGCVPSYTKLGMAALLPNTKITRNENYQSDDILVDNRPTSSITDRENILKNQCEDSIAIKYSDLYDKTKLEWKKLFSGKKVIYIYHDEIDKTGEHDDAKVFDACERTIDELFKLTKDLHTTFSGVDLFITADHGFFYKKSKNESSSKIKKDDTATKLKRRFSYSENKLNQEGFFSIDLKYIFGENSGYVNIPKGNAVFSIQGLSSSYVHGGLMPQEIIIPVIDFKSTRNIEEISKVKVTYSGMFTKISNAVVYLDFAQNNPVDENNKSSRYTIHFEDENENRISNECIIIADNTSNNVKDRFYKEKFVFKNLKYDRNKDYYLIIRDEETLEEIERVKFVIDISLSNSFTF